MSTRLYSGEFHRASGIMAFSLRRCAAATGAPGPVVALKFAGLRGSYSTVLRLAPACLPAGSHIGGYLESNVLPFVQFARAGPRNRADVNENVGRTVVNQDEADRDIPKLLGTPTVWRGLSMEPLLGPINLEEHLGWLDWVVVRGESGAGWRTMDPNWALSLCCQCQAFGVSFHFKQWSGFRPHELGRFLDGREHNGMPPCSKDPTP